MAAVTHSVHQGSVRLSLSSHVTLEMDIREKGSIKGRAADLAKVMAKKRNCSTVGKALARRQRPRGLLMKPFSFRSKNVEGISSGEVRPCSANASGLDNEGRTVSGLGFSRIPGSRAEAP